MRKRGSIETTTFGLIGAAVLTSAPALAIDLQVGGGGLGVSIGNGGVQVGGGGIGVSIGKGGVNVGGGGARVGTGNHGPSAGASIGGNQISVGRNVESVVVDPPAAVAALGQAAVFTLPGTLLPRELCGLADSDYCDADSPDEGRDIESLIPHFVVPIAIIAACRKGITKAASAYDYVQVDVVGTGSVQTVEGGRQIAPLVVRIVYDRQGGYETREARVSCHVDALGNAVALT
jgi:hypothetical protein